MGNRLTYITGGPVCRQQLVGQTIYKGPEDAATQYCRGKMAPDLTEEMTPVVEERLARVGAVKACDDVMGQYKNIPFMPDVKEDLNGYVVKKGIDGIFSLPGP